MLGVNDVYDNLNNVLPSALRERVFERFAGVVVPHAARMGFRVRKLTATEIEVTMPDRRGNRNHLSSLHAMALAHLGEYTSGLLLLYAVHPLGYRTILRKFSIEYVAKARGTITGRASVKLPKGSLDKKDISMKVELVDEAGTVVARATPMWRVGKNR